MKGYRVIVGLVVLAFAGGIFGGYRIWGTTESGETDLPRLMQQLSGEVNRMESRNRELAESLESSREKIDAAEAIRQENQELKDRLQNALREKQEMQGALAQARAEERKADDRAEGRKQLRETVDGLKGRIESLENENRELSARMQALQQENRELNSVIDNVSEMTRGKATTGR